MRLKSRVIISVVILCLVFYSSIIYSANQNTNNGISESIILETKSGNIYGTLELPGTTGNWPIVILIAGSGPTNKDGNSEMLPGPNNSLKMIALELSNNGIASLRYDKRGIGESKLALKSEKDIRFENYIDDVILWIELLKKDPRFTKIVIAGHSEGSLIGMLAAGKAKINGYISIAGSGRAMDVLLQEQLAKQPDNIKSECKRIIDKLKTGELVPDIDPILMTLFRPSVQPYLISLFKYNPSVEISKLDMPVLIIQGKNDLQIKVTDANLLYKSKPDAKILVIDLMNHVLKKVTNYEENVASYSNPSFPLADGLINEIEIFVKGCL